MYRIRRLLMSAEREFISDYFDGFCQHGNMRLNAREVFDEMAIRWDFAASRDFSRAGVLKADI